MRIASTAARRLPACRRVRPSGRGARHFPHARFECRCDRERSSLSHRSRALPFGSDAGATSVPGRRMTTSGHEVCRGAGAVSGRVKPAVFGYALLLAYCPPSGTHLPDDAASAGGRGCSGGWWALLWNMVGSLCWGCGGVVGGRSFGVAGTLRRTPMGTARPARVHPTGRWPRRPGSSESIEHLRRGVGTVDGGPARSRRVPHAERVGSAGSTAALRSPPRRAQPRALSKRADHGGHRPSGEATWNTVASQVLKTRRPCAIQVQRRVCRSMAGTRRVCWEADLAGLPSARR